MPDPLPRVLYLLSHPIQYQAPMLRYLAASGRIDVHTLFIRTIGNTPYADPGFGTTVQWDLPLTDGYSHEFLRGIGSQEKVSRWTPWSVGLRRAADRFQPDAVWVHGYDTVNAVRLMTWAKVRRIPVLARAEVEWSDAHGGPIVRVAKDGVLRAAFRSINGFLAIGEKNASFYREHAVPEEKIFHVPYAVDNERFAAAHDGKGPDQLSRFAGLPQGRPAFLFSGKLISRKRPLDAVEAIARLRDAHRIDANLVIVGSGELETAIKEATGRLGLEDRVAMLGFLNQSEIVKAYGWCTALLLPSDRERWGLVANEAMAAGAPVIASDAVGCAGDLVQNGISGFVVPAGDVAAWASAAARLCHPVERECLSVGARNRVSDFSFESMLEGLLAAVRSTR